jgi:23S rRNA pseudouridine1911/1915/1917 synthase
LAGQQKELKSLTAGAEHAGMRLDVFITSGLVAFSRTKIQKLIKQGEVLVNGKVAEAGSLAMAEGDLVEITGTIVERPDGIEPVAMPLEILYEDEYLIVINKPAGIAVHPGAGTKGPTLVQGLLHHCRTLSRGSVLDEDSDKPGDRPGIVHRLDKDTTGAMVCARTDEVHAALAKQFQDKTRLVREYAAVLDGVMPATEITRESWLYRDSATRQRFLSADLEKKPDFLPEGTCRYAKSVFSAIAVYGKRVTVARVRLYTGRTHQIRVHALDLGLPIIGDQLYHRPCQLPHQFPEALRDLVYRQSRQLLHARILGFEHPVTGKRMEVKAPFPEDFSNIIGMMERVKEAGE